MPFNFNINLPGPFTYSVPVSPAKSAGKVVRAGAAVLREDRAYRAAVEREIPRPIGGRVTDDTDWGSVIVWGFVVALLLALAIAGFAGFRL